ncbi:MAG: hypothetical protein GY841_11245, partial [FCB group bacterium]|nr:hypothetical protein [FCB group bacterium]
STSHDCTDDCESDTWATMARFGRMVDASCNGSVNGTYTLDIEYINDKTAGGAIQTESGIWTTNPVMWLTTPCRPEVHAPAYSDDAGSGYGECYTDFPLVLQPDSSITKSFTMENTGLQDNAFTITPVYDDGDGWIVATPNSGTILAGLNNTVIIDITFNVPAGAPDPSAWFADIEIDHAAEGSPRILPVCLTVASKFVYPQEAFIATTCKELRVYNNGELSGDADTASLDFNGDCDTLHPNANAQSYLYTGAPVFSYIKGDDTLLFTSAFGRSFVEDNSLRPIDSFSLIPDTSLYPGDSLYLGLGIADAIRTKFYTADSAIGVIAEYYSPSDGANCSFVIQKIKFWNRTADTIWGVTAGEAFDWDVPTDWNYDTLAIVNSGNTSGYDSTRMLIYQQGIELNDDSISESYEVGCGQQSDDRFAGVAPGPNTFWMNAQTLGNPTWVYTTGPYGFLAPLPAGATHAMMTAVDTPYVDLSVSRLEPIVDLWESPNDDTPYVDLSTLVSFGYYDLAPNDTVCAIKILSTSRDGLTYMEEMVDYA